MPNDLPPWEVVVGALGPYLAHATGIRERASKAYLDAVDRERPLNMVNCWHRKIPAFIVFDLWAMMLIGGFSVREHLLGFFDRNIG